MKTAYLPETANRVSQNTPKSFNDAIEADTIQRLQRIGSDRNNIEARLKELDREWDIERAIEANASTLLLTTLALGSAVNGKWLLASGVIATFLLQHAVQGWCPPVPILRRLGFRTQREIDNERAILLGRIDALPDARTESHEALQMLKH